jgi:hypothetical protein
MLIYLQGKFHPNWLKQMGGIPTKLQKFKIITPTVVICLVAYGPKHKKATRLWNNLDKETKDSSTLPIFKHKLQKSSYKPKIYNRKCTGKHGNWITRLRLGLSALNCHRFTYNFIDNPYCENCPNVSENTLHYLFECPIYAIARIELMDGLSQEIGLDITNLNELIFNMLFGDTHASKHKLLIDLIIKYMIATERFN